MRSSETPERSLTACWNSSPGFAHAAACCSGHNNTSTNNVKVCMHHMLWNGGLWAPPLVRYTLCTAGVPGDVNAAR